jgi:hypothetical protein
LAPQPADERFAFTLSAVAARQGLAGLLHAAAERDRSWPHPARELLLREHRLTCYRAVQQFETLRRAHAAMCAAGLRVLPLKGAALAGRVYADAADRPMADVDLLVLDDFRQAARVLAQAGFDQGVSADHAVAFTDRATGCVVELHHALSACPGFYPVNADAVWLRSRAHRGVPWRTPCDEDLLVQLSIHAAFQHGLRLRLIQYLDVKRLLERNPDPTALAASAREHRAEAALFACLEAARLLVGARAPSGAGLPQQPRAFRTWLERELAEPLELLDGEGVAAPIAAARWHLAAGRRLEAMRRALGFRGTGEGGLSMRTIARAAARAAGLLRRWTAAALRP